MFHKIKNVSPLPDYCLSVQFTEGCTKIYDVKPLFEQIPAFEELKDPHLFSDVTVDVGGYGIVWNDDLDLSSDELWENGVVAETPFDGLMAFSDATTLWSLNDNPLLPKYLELLESTVKYYMANKTYNSNDIISSLFEAFLSLLCTINPVKKSLDNDILKSIAYIESHYSEDIVIKDLASSLFLSEDYFIRKFKKNMGMTPYAYLSRLRLSIAGSLIAEGMPLTEAAIATGYQYPSSLCHALKKNQQWDNYKIFKSLSEIKKIQASNND